MKNKILNITSFVLLLLVTALIFYVKGDYMNSGINTKHMDLQVNAGDDFYDFATAGWRRANPIPDDFSRYGAFDKLRDENLDRMKKIVTDISSKKNAANTLEYKIATLYSQAIDDKKLNKQGISPVFPDLQEIDNIKTKSEFMEYLGKFHRVSSAFWGDGVEEDMKDSKMNLYSIGQGGLGLPERDYYLDKDSADIRKKYKEYMKTMFEHFGISGDPMRVYEIEYKLAKAFMPKEELRDPHKIYHRRSMAEFSKKYKSFDWKKYFDARGVKPANINDATPDSMDAALNIINKTSLDDLKMYLKWNVINSAAGYLDDKTYKISFDFYRKTLSGVKEPKPRWKRALGMLDSIMGEATGKIYVDKYFPPRAKTRMLKLVENLQNAYAERISNLDWMDSSTKQRALEKLSKMRVKIGYPNKWRDYSKLQVVGDSYWADIKRASIFDDEYILSKADKPVDPELWLMNPQEVNAYYNPTTNEICFPAGILQPPFFDMDADDAYNYGAIGSVIGHEMTHGFDDMGRKFDADGNLKDWWTAKDAKSFDSRAKVMEKFFNNIIVAPGVHANGKFTLGENLADYGGVTISFAAYKSINQPAKIIDGFSSDQRFFIAYAGTEAGNIRDQEVLKLNKTDEHSLSRWRVNGILPHISGWYDAFKVTPDNKLYIPEKERVDIW